MKSAPFGSKVIIPILVAVLVAPIVSCTQPGVPSAAAPTQAAKALANGSKPEAAEARPQTKAAAGQDTAKSPPKEVNKLVKLRAAYSAVSGSQAPLWVAKEKNLFEKYGLDVDVQYIASSTTVAPAMIAGDVQVAITAAGAIVSADLQGADLVVIATTDEVLPFSLFVLPSIQRVEDLKGQKVGVSRFGSATDYAARQTLKKYGFEPDKDVAVVEMGGVPELRAGLQSGAIQGSVFGPPDSLLARKLGMRELISYADLNNVYPTGSLAVSKKYLAGNQETMRNFMKAFVEGIATTKNDKDYAMQVISKYAKIDDREVLDETHQIYVAKLMPKIPYASVEGMQVTLDDTARQNPKAKDFKPETFIDNSLVKELDDSGFIKKLYGE